MARHPRAYPSATGSRARSCGRFMAPPWPLSKGKAR